MLTPVATTTAPVLSTGAVCVLAAVGALGRLAEPWAAYVEVAAGVYLVVSLSMAS
jgi:hypothetical protein